MDTKWSQISRSSVERNAHSQNEIKIKPFSTILYGSQVALELDDFCQNYQSDKGHENMKNSGNDLNFNSDTSLKVLGSRGDFGSVQNSLPLDLFIEASVNGPMMAKLKLENGTNNSFLPEGDGDDVYDSDGEPFVKIFSDDTVQKDAISQTEWRKYFDIDNETRFDLDFMEELENDVTETLDDTILDDKTEVKRAEKNWPLSFVQTNISCDYSSISIQNHTKNSPIMKDNTIDFQISPKTEIVCRSKLEKTKSLIHRIPQQELYPPFKTEGITQHNTLEKNHQKQHNRKGSELLTNLSLGTSSVIHNVDVMFTQAKIRSKHLKQKIRHLSGCNMHEQKYNKVNVSKQERI